MLYIGCHLSSSKGFAAMGRQALELGANTFQFFTRNPRGSRAKDLDPADAAALRDLLARTRLRPHRRPRPLHPEPLRRGGEEPDIRPGDHGGRPAPGWSTCRDSITTSTPAAMWGRAAETGIALIADGLNAILRPDQATTVLLETMAGKGSEVGGRFEELRAILDRVELSGQDGRLPGHLPRVRRRLRHRPRPGRRADGI